MSYEMEEKQLDIIVKNRSIGDIPVLELYDTGHTEKRPMVIMYHGYLARKEFNLPQAYNLAARGFYVVVPDAFGHGDRSSNKIMDLLTAITKSAEEIDGLIDSYEGHQLADNKRVGLTGFSMGGCITFYYLVAGKKQIKAAAPLISTPDWASIIDGFAASKDKIKQLISYGIIEKEEDLPEYRSMAERIQPINYYQEMKDIPLLMLCGEKDEVTPPHGVIKLYEKLEPLTRDKEALRYKVYPGLVHCDTVEMNMELADWLKKYL